MRDTDLAFVQRLRDAHKIVGPVLELGAGYGGPTARCLFDNGTAYFTTDLTGDVDYCADFESTTIKLPVAFRTILILNILEHVFEPLKVLDNALRLLLPGGSLVITTPAIWSLHGYPIDCCRLLPNFYERYAETRGLALDPDAFDYLEYGPVRDARNHFGNLQYPFSRWLLLCRLFRARLSIGARLEKPHAATMAISA
ncbi:MAG TPA: methyltransferase domain-containing protein [Candidatus Paceibacterota bacterium]